MALDLPTPSSTIGPDWSVDLNTALTTVDSHDHTSGSGQKVPTGGLNINADLNFNDNGLNSLNEATFKANTTDTATNLTIWVKNGDLYYKDSGGNAIQMTSGGAVNVGSVGGIGGDYSTTSATLFYTDASLTYFFQDSTSAASKIDIGELACTIVSPTTRIGNVDGTAALPTYTFASDTDTGMWRSGADTLNFSTGGTERLEIDSTGIDATVDINTSTNMQAVDITATDNLLASLGAVATPSHSFTGDLDTGMWSSAADIINFSAGGTEVLEIDGTSIDATVDLITSTNMQAVDITATDNLLASLGAVGTPSHTFTGDTDTGMYSSAANILNFAAGGTEILEVDETSVDSTVDLRMAGNKVVFDSDNDSYLYASADDTVKMYTAGSETQVWNVSGNSGLGTSSPGARYEVKSTDGTATPAIRVRKTNSGSSQELVDFYRNDTTFSGSIRLSATNLLIDNTSDERLKTNIQEITNGLNIVDSLRSVTFDWKDHPEDCPNDIKGFIAQETETVLPHSVTTRDDDLGTKTMSQHEMIPVLWSAVRELSTKNKELEDRLALLEG
jgi:hypothetical protein